MRSCHWPTEEISVRFTTAFTKARYCHLSYSRHSPLQHIFYSHSKTTSSKEYSFLQTPQLQFTTNLSIFPHALHAQPILSVALDHSDNVSLTAQITKFLILQFAPASCQTFSLRPRYITHLICVILFTHPHNTRFSLARIKFRSQNIKQRSMMLDCIFSSRDLV